MHSMIISMIILINISFLVAMPSLFLDYPINEDLQINHLVKRYQLSPWIHKRNPTLCDYRLQLRPLPLTSALCSYGSKIKKISFIHLFLSFV